MRHDALDAHVATTRAEVRPWPAASLAVDHCRLGRTRGSSSSTPCASGSSRSASSSSPSGARYIGIYMYGLFNGYVWIWMCACALRCAAPCCSLLHRTPCRSGTARCRGGSHHSRLSFRRRLHVRRSTLKRSATRDASTLATLFRPLGLAGVIFCTQCTVFLLALFLQVCHRRTSCR